MLPPLPRPRPRPAPLPRAPLPLPLPLLAASPIPPPAIAPSSDPSADFLTLLERYDPLLLALSLIADMLDCSLLVSRLLIVLAFVFACFSSFSRAICNSSNFFWNSVYLCSFASSLYSKILIHLFIFFSWSGSLLSLDVVSDFRPLMASCISLTAVSRFYKLADS